MPGNRILVADDEPFIRELFVDLLSISWEVTAVSSGEEAVRHYRESGADLVLIDLQMPGIGGLEACRSLRATPGGGTVPIILMSGDSESVGRAAAEDVGADDFVAKPPDFARLMSRISRLLGDERAA